MADINKLLEELKAAPFTEINIIAPHTGVVQFASLCVGDKIYGPSGAWKEIPGTKLATITRENNPKPVLAKEKGVIRTMNTFLEGKFVEMGTILGTLRHYLSKREVVRILLQHSLSLFRAPERAKYYFVPEIDKKVKISGSQSITVHDGMELLIASRMKRESPVTYHGPDGIIYEVYFHENQNVETGAPLIGVCPIEQRGDIEDVVTRVQMEWSEVE